jgi:hypothetical protein
MTKRRLDPKHLVGAARRLPLPIKLVAGVAAIAAALWLTLFRPASGSKALQEQEAYREYDQAVAAVADPKTATDLKQLDEIESNLNDLNGDPKYDWSETGARHRRDLWLKDVHNLRSAVVSTRTAYEDIIRDGNKVNETRDEANLPGRIREVLARAKNLPDPEQDKEKGIPGSKRITYSSVFRIQPLLSLYSQWKDIEKSLKELLRAFEPESP